MGLGFSGLGVSSLVVFSGGGGLWDMRSGGVGIAGLQGFGRRGILKFLGVLRFRGLGL